MRLDLTVNGIGRRIDVEPYETLLETLRTRLALTGTKLACAEGECGACTVIVDGDTINSCLMPALAVNGSEVTTVEGLANGSLAPIQDAIVASGGVQCGFCTPGFLMTVHSFLKENPDPADDEIRMAIAGNLCRCTGYAQIVDAVKLIVTQGA